LRGLLQGFGIGASRIGRWRQRIVDRQGEVIEEMSLEIWYVIIALGTGEANCLGKMARWPVGMGGLRHCSLRKLIIKISFEKKL
jgi:hypothetical protein